MVDYIIIEKVWADTDLIELALECKSSYVCAKNKYYTCKENIHKLIYDIDKFLLDSKKEFLWENGQKGDKSTAYFSLNFSHKDINGHVLIEIYMEIDDGGSFEKHNCCFFVNTEIGQLDFFLKDLSKLFIEDMGVKVVLGNQS